jgi:hypothetical protein
LPALVLAGLLLAAFGFALELWRAFPEPPPPGPSSRNEQPRFYQDFRGKPVSEEFFEYTGARDRIKEEPGGLRIDLPGPDMKVPASGILTGFHLTGDCTITTSYELLHVDESKQSWGAGASLYVMTGTASRDAALLANFVRPDGHFYVCQRITTNADGKRQFFTRSFPTEARSGKLRLVRRGAVVTYFVADDGKEEFQELHQFEVSADDFQFARIAADAGGQDVPVDLRFHDLEIRSREVPEEARTDGAAEPPRREKKWLAAAGLVVLGVVLSLATAALGVRLYRRRGREPAPGAEQRPGPAAAARVLAFACSACGKNLKAGAGLAGKKARCRHCGAVVPIPEAGAGAAGGPPL